VLTYHPDGRFDRVLPMKADVGKRKVEDVGIASKTVEAVTHWELLEISKRAPISLVKLELKTGAKHQLRIHLSKVLNTPVLGDPLYSNNNLSYVPGIGVQRCLYLHSSQVSFFSYRQFGSHKRFRVGVTAPLPPYFLQACQKLKIRPTHELITGGVRINDIPQNLLFLRDGVGTENDMRWLI